MSPSFEQDRKPRAVHSTRLLVDAARIGITPVEVEPLRVSIIADDPLVRSALAGMLSSASATTASGPAAQLAVAQISGGEDVLLAVQQHHADVVLWDLGLDARRLGVGLLERILVPTVVLIAPPARDVDDRARESLATEALVAGARGVLLRDVPGATLLAALVAAAHDLVTLDPSLLVAINGRRLESRRSAGDAAGETDTSERRDRGSPIDELTAREAEVLEQLTEGLANKVIAQRLGISEHTVKFHVNAILAKLGAESRTDAVVRAARMGLVIL